MFSHELLVSFGLGLCVKGPNVMIYPQKVWFSEVFPDDVNDIVSAIERIMEDD